MTYYIDVTTGTAVNQLVGGEAPNGGSRYGRKSTLPGSFESLMAPWGDLGGFINSGVQLSGRFRAPVIQIRKPLTILAMIGTSGTLDFQGYLQLPLDLGDIILEDQSDTLFLVTGIISGQKYSISAYSNTRMGGFINPVSGTAGLWWCSYSRVYTTSLPLYGAIVAGQTTITNCGAANGSAAFLGTDLAVGDYIILDNAVDNSFPNPTKITSITGTTITMSNSATRSQLGYFMPYWLRVG